jgi:uncharacterized membrane protein
MPRSPRHATYWPLGLTLALVLFFPALAIVVLLGVGILASTFQSIGLTPLQAVLAVAASFAAAPINIPVKTLDNEVSDIDVVRVFGVSYLVPVRRRAHTLVALNLGGAVVPSALSAYIWWRTGFDALPLAVVAPVCALCYLLARPVPGLGIALPALVPALVAAAFALAIAPHHAGALAYIGGTLGTLVGADLLHMREIRGLGAPIVSIGGAGTFDGIFLSGLLAVLLATLL